MSQGTRNPGVRGEAEILIDSIHKFMKRLQVSFAFSIASEPLDALSHENWFIEGTSVSKVRSKI